MDADTLKMIMKLNGNFFTLKSRHKGDDGCKVYIADAKEIQGTIYVAYVYYSDDLNDSDYYWIGKFEEGKVIATYQAILENRWSNLEKFEFKF